MKRSIRTASLLSALSFAIQSLAPAVVLADPKPAAEEEADEAEGDESESEAPAEGEKGKAPSRDEAAEAEAAEAEAAEAELDEDAVNINKPPPKGKGAIVGVITDTKFSEAIIEGQVQLLGTKRKVLTDTEGRFRIELPPGNYSIRIVYELHQATRVDNIKVVAGELNRVDAQLTPDEKAVETVVIDVDADRTSLEGQTLQRQRSAAVGDGVGRAEIARTPDRNAAEAAQRVVGATIVGSRFVYVRGLGERYTNALLNGTPLPSTEPDRQTVPLDLFPSLILDSITIAKQFTPDMPGDFAGGSVRIFTRDFPRERLFQISFNSGIDTQSTFQGRPASRGSSTDWLGFDNGQRSLPSGLPSRRINKPETSEDERYFWGRRANSYMSTRRDVSPPNFGLGIVAGDSVKLGTSSKLGAIATFNYGRSFKRTDVTLQRYFPEVGAGGSLIPVRTDYGQGEQGVDSVRWGAFGNVALELNKNDKLNLTAFRSQSADNSASDFEAYSRNSNGTFRSIHQEYVSRSLTFGQLRGSHKISALGDAELDWHLAIASAARDQPDTRDIDYRRSAPGSPFGYTWSDDLESGAHFYSKQSEATKGAGLDYAQPFARGKDIVSKFKLGGLLTSRRRNFDARRFRFEPAGGSSLPGFDDAQSCGGAWVESCPNKLFVDPYIGPGGLIFSETTLRFDQYVAALDVLSGYAMVDVQPSKQVRLIGGARVENTRQSFEAYDPFDRVGTRESSKINSSDVLPAASVLYSVSRKNNLRLGLSRTIARPQLREIAPFLSSSYTGDLPTQGYSGLKLTQITNLDLRFEQFPTLREVLAFSFFFKHFKDPIEEVVLAGTQSGLLSYRNAPSANLIGLELEARKNLAFLSDVLNDITFIGNLTLIKSMVDLGTTAGVATSRDRPLSNQAPYVLNLSLDYGSSTSGTDLRLLYNIYGARLTTVGSQNLPDTYELPRHSLDFTAAQKIAKHFEVKFTAANLLGSDLIYAHRGVTGYLRAAPGVLAFPSPDQVDPVVYRYNLGTILTLTATYTY